MSTKQAQVSDEKLAEIEARANAASVGPWRSMRDGNQYVGVELDPRKGKSVIHPEGRGTLVGTSRVVGLQRPWNPWWVGDSTSPETQETVRLKDEDADFVAHARADVPALIAEVRRLRSALSTPSAQYDVAALVEALEPFAYRVSKAVTEVLNCEGCKNGHPFHNVSICVTYAEAQEFARSLARERDGGK